MISSLVRLGRRHMVNRRWRLGAVTLGFTTTPGAHTRFRAENIEVGFPDLKHGFAPVVGVLAPGDIVPYFEPEDLDAALENAVNHGGRILLEPVESAPGHWVAIVDDPSGAKIALTRIRRGDR